MNDWIDINDDLPEIPIPVLVWIKDGCTIGYFEQKEVLRDKRLFGWQTEIKEQWYDIHGGYLYGIIAWQPLPFGPNGEALIDKGLVNRDEQNADKSV